MTPNVSRPPSYAPGTLLRVSQIIPPPLRRETAQPRPAWRPGDVVLPACISDSALPHEATDAPSGSGLPHDDSAEVTP